MPWRNATRELASANDLKDRFLQQLHQEVARQTGQIAASESRYRLLVEIGRIVNAELELRPLLSRAAAELRRLTGCDHVSLTLATPLAAGQHGLAVDFSGDTPRWREVPDPDASNSAVRWVTQHRQPRIARRLEQARPFAEDRRLYEAGLRASLLLPLLARGEPVGVLGLACREASRLDGWDLGLLGEVGEVLALAVSNAAAYDRIARLTAQLQQENGVLRSELRESAGAPNSPVGTGPAWSQVRASLAQVAPTDSTVLITGETGTGKELVARAIHEGSPRRERLLVRVNLAALSSELVPSELFGHEAGAFTGATKQRLGRFELADGGTLFLDEIGDISADMQVLLLRALQERLVERVGGSTPIAVDVRLIAATNRDLPALVRQGRFRPDLFFRLNVFPIHLPPLRERPEDIPALIDSILARLRLRLGRALNGVSPAGLRHLLAHSWPGNVRELENILERASIIATGPALEIDPAWLHTPEAPSASPSPSPGPSPSGTAWQERERQTILEALRACGGRMHGPQGAAARLGLKPSTLYNKMRRLGLRKPAGDSPAAE